ncbi:MAG TPA: hypothetical protein VL527_18880, partial [Dongiaceae bacterium]|nr:hypothetical protein [Dongiaceae bacterium]
MRAATPDLPGNSCSAASATLDVFSGFFIVAYCLATDVPCASEPSAIGVFGPVCAEIKGVRSDFTWSEPFSGVSNPATVAVSLAEFDIPATVVTSTGCDVVLAVGLAAEELEASKFGCAGSGCAGVSVLPGTALAGVGMLAPAGIAVSASPVLAARAVLLAEVSGAAAVMLTGTDPWTASGGLASGSCVAAAGLAIWASSGVRGLSVSPAGAAKCDGSDGRVLMGAQVGSAVDTGARRGAAAGATIWSKLSWDAEPVLELIQPDFGAT